MMAKFCSSQKSLYLRPAFCRKIHARNPDTPRRVTLQTLAGYGIHDYGATHDRPTRASAFTKSGNRLSSTSLTETGLDEKLHCSLPPLLPTLNLTTVHVRKFCQLHRCRINQL